MPSTIQLIHLLNIWINHRQKHNGPCAYYVLKEETTTLRWALFSVPPHNIAFAGSSDAKEQISALRPVRPVVQQSPGKVTLTLLSRGCWCSMCQMGKSLDHCLREPHWALKIRALGSSAFAKHVWIYPRSCRYTPTASLRLAAFWGPGTSSTNNPHSTGIGVHCHQSMLHYWPDCTTIWHSFITVLLLFFILVLHSRVCRLVNYLLEYWKFPLKISKDLRRCKKIHYLSWFCLPVYVG